MTRVQRVPSFFGLGCPQTSVPQVDRTMLRRCSAAWSVGASLQRTIEQCSPSCSTTASAQQFVDKPRLGAAGLGG